MLHSERGGGAHVHVLAARCDLETGRSLNIASPGWRRTFDPLRDALNHEHGWGRPDDPTRDRDRVQQPGHRAYVEAELAHLVKNKVEAAYMRSDLFERRRRLTAEWAAYLAGER